jgi:3-oxoacyl-[acyl-carrier protein] reductase
MLLQDKTAIITGATRGIGKAVLTRFAEEGASVIGIYHSNDEAARQIEEQYRSLDCSVQLIKGSVEDRDFIKDLMKRTKAEFKKIDILVNNAGIVKDNLSMMMKLEEWDSVFQTNFQGTFNGCTEVIPYMLEQQYGKVVNVVSVSGYYGREGQMNYATSKGAIIGLTRMLARRYAKHGIYFNAVAPGMIQSEMIGQVSPSKMDNFLQHTNLKRPGELEEVADAILYLASDLSDYVSDTVLKVDGGFMR